MEACTRHLREGAVKDDGSGCALVLVCDDLDTTAAKDFLVQLSHDFTSTVKQQRAQASSTTLLLIESSASSFVLERGPSLRIVDGFSDAHGWASAISCSSGDSSSGHEICSPCKAGSTLDDLASLLLQPRHMGVSGPAGGTSTSGQPHSLCLIIDSLTPLLLHFSTAKVLRFLEQLRTHPQVSCILTSLHQDVHPGRAVCGVQSLATCVVQLRPVGSLLCDMISRQISKTAHGVADFRYKRRTGRVRVESLLYTLMQHGALELYPAPAGVGITPEALVTLAMKEAGRLPPSGTATTAAAAAGSGGAGGGNVVGASAAAAAAPAAGAGGGGGKAEGADELSKVMAGGMRLTLTEQERAAKQQVVLPYEHQGQSQTYQSADFKTYLPPAAGGHGQAAGGRGENRLGHILYVRDSDEEHDSDEDPDDDLDI